MKKIILGFGVLVFVVGIVAISTGTALAYQGGPTRVGPNYSVERHTAMTQAFENKDYTAWKNLMQNKGRVGQIVTQTNFAKFVEVHNLAVQGKTAEAQKIRQELGLGTQNGLGRMSGMGRGFNR